MPLDEPGRVVGLAELEQRPAQVLDGVEAPHPKHILLQGADEALGAAVALRRADEGRRALDAEEAQRLLVCPGGDGTVSDVAGNLSDVVSGLCSKPKPALARRRRPRHGQG